MDISDLPEGGRIDSDDGTLDERLGSHQFVVRRVVHSVYDTRLAGDACKNSFTFPEMLNSLISLIFEKKNFFTIFLHVLLKCPKLTLRSPGEGACIETESTEFDVASTHAHQVDSLGSDLKAKFLKIIFSRSFFFDFSKLDPQK